MPAIRFRHQGGYHDQRRTIVAEDPSTEPSQTLATLEILIGICKAPRRRVRQTLSETSHALYVWHSTARLSTTSTIRTISFLEKFRLPVTSQHRQESRILKISTTMTEAAARKTVYRKLSVHIMFLDKLESRDTTLRRGYSAYRRLKRKDTQAERYAEDYTDKAKFLPNNSRSNQRPMDHQQQPAPPLRENDRAFDSFHGLPPRE